MKQLIFLKQSQIQFYLKKNLGFGRAVNFAAKSKLVNWFTGGLNYQVEHHIFPNISHVHYDKIAKIVKKTSSDFNLPYNEFNTFFDAIRAHFKFLKTMGVKPQNA